jgi:hypothetical protein
LFFLFAAHLCYSQDDSSKIKIGPEDLLNLTKGRYFNYADKNKVNIEIVVLGTSAGRYLIPQGTTLFDFLLMSGGTNSHLIKDIKIVRFKSESPILKANEVFEYDYSDLYGDRQEILKSHKNPILKPGDMVILPETKASDQTVFYYIRETIAFVGTLVSFYYLIDNIIRRNK